MKKPTPRALSPAMVIAMIALFVSLGGTGYAASQLSGSPTAVAGKTSKKTKKPVQKTLRGKTGPTGYTGATGATGPAGGAGKEGTAGKEGKEGPRGPSNGYQAFKDSLGKFTTLATVGTLAVPAGSYLVSAKLWV